MIHDGHFDEDGMRGVLGAGLHPARNPEQNIADLKAQAAACHRGAEELRRAVARYGAETVAAYMRHVQDNAEEEVRHVDRPAHGRRVRDGQWTAAPSSA